MDRTYSEVVNAAGAATITLRTPGMEVWIVQQVSIEAKDAPPGAAANLRKNGALITVMVAAGDVADSDPPVTLRPGETITIEWTGLTIGQIVSAYIIFMMGDRYS